MIEKMLTLDVTSGELKHAGNPNRESTANMLADFQTWDYALIGALSVLLSISLIRLHAEKGSYQDKKPKQEYTRPSLIQPRYHPLFNA